VGELVQRDLCFTSNVMIPATRTRFGATDWFVALVMNLMWGLNIIAVKMSVDLVEPLTAAALRQIIVFLVCFHALRIIPGKMRELVALGILSGGLFYVVVNLSFAVSSNVSALAIAGQLGAPFSLILAGSVAFAGVILLAFDPDAANELPGLGLTAIASMLWAICSLIQRALKGVPILTIYAWVGVLGSLTLFPLAALVEPEAVRTIPKLPLQTLGWICFSAIGSTLMGQGAMSWLLQRHPISTVVPLSLPTPVLSVIAATLYFKTPLTPVMIAGGVLVMIGVSIITIRTAMQREQGELESAA
jgi:O-acetylserine/cysteine efflux transporter